jgi:sulfide:quinone oxidoreductase
MQILRISPALAIADQIEELDVQTLAASGVKSIICNRPDSEGGTPSERIRAACARLGVKFFSQPVDYAALGVADGDEFGRILQQCDEPVLAYCRTGRRSAALWAIAAAPLDGAQAVAARTARIGIGLDEIAPVLMRSAARSDPPYAPSSDQSARERFMRLWIKE